MTFTMERILVALLSFPIVGLLLVALVHFLGFVALVWWMATAKFLTFVTWGRPRAWARRQIS